MAFNFVQASSQYTNLTSHSAGIKTANGSLVVWFKSSTTGSRFTLFGIGNATNNFGGLVIGNGGWIGGASSLGWGLLSGGWTLLMGVSNGANYYLDGNLHCFILVCDGVDNRIYVDGVKETTVFTVGNATTSNGFLNLATMGNVYIGRDGRTGGEYTNGVQEYTKIYTRSLTDQDAQNIWAGRGSDCVVDGQKAWWLFEGQSPGVAATNLQDLSGNSYDGTPTNSPTLIDESIRLTQ